MGCCESKEEPEREEPVERGCTDVFWLCLYIAFWFLMVNNALCFTLTEITNYFRY